MARWAARIEYIGTAYSGWQRLTQIKSVQAELERALSKIANHDILVFCSGRTDAGVHSLGQIVHFDSDVIRTGRDWMMGCNSLLPRDISVRWVMPVSEQFHARHKAFSRKYRYVIHNHSARSALAMHRTAFWPRPLDAKKMHQAARCLVGKHDFSALRHTGCQSPTPIRIVHQLDVFRVEEFVVIDISANAFLHHMVRNIAGTLIEVGEGAQPVEWVAKVLSSGDRRLAGKTAEADGLTFIGPEYPPEYGIPLPPTPWFPVVGGGVDFL